MKTLIAQLNKMALANSTGENIDLPGIEKTLDDFGLEFEATDTNDFGEESCRIYRAADDTLINCWVYSPNADGLGFDDQTGWFVDDLITQAAAAEIAGVSVAAINNAIRDGRLRSYREPGAAKHRPGANLVSESDARKLW